MTFVLDILCTLFFSPVKLGVVPNLSSSCENLIIMVALMLCILTFKATNVASHWHCVTSIPNTCALDCQMTLLITVAADTLWPWDL